MEFTNEPETTEEVILSENDISDEPELETLAENESSVESIEEDSIFDLESQEEDESIVLEVESSSVSGVVEETFSTEISDDSVVINHWSNGVFYNNNFVYKDYISGSYFYMGGSSIVYIDSVYYDEIESSNWDFGQITAYYGNYVVYYNYHGVPFYFDGGLNIRWINDTENITYVSDSNDSGNMKDETLEDSTGDIISDTESLVLTINQQTEVIQKGNAAICMGLGLLIGILLIQGFRLRRV